jgi:hypothetical protein
VSAAKTLLTVLLTGWAMALPSLATAGEPLIEHTDGSVRIGTPRLLDAAWAEPLSTQEMSEERGGIRGMSFSVHFDGMVNGTSGEGILHLIGPDGVIVTDGVPDPSVNANAVDIQSFIGDVGPFNGLGQFAIVSGDGNDVSNNLTVNIFVTDDAGATNTFTDVLSGIDGLTP